MVLIGMIRKVVLSMVAVQCNQNIMIMNLSELKARNKGMSEKSTSLSNGQVCESNTDILFRSTLKQNKTEKKETKAQEEAQVQNVKHLDSLCRIQELHRAVSYSYITR